jgi:TatD DNase family protein
MLYSAFWILDSDFMSPLIDSHAHLEMRQFRADLEQVLEHAHASGVTHIITVGSTLAESRRALKIAEKYDEVSAVVGVHPHDAADVDESVMTQLAKLARKSQVVGIGETGLDFFRDRSPRPLQEKAFRRHLKLAGETRLPVVIHVRDAYSRTLEILMEEGIPERGGVVHCFSGTLDDAEAFLKLGLYLSFTGTVTYEGRKNREWSERVLSKVPLERIMVETDCPYLTPHPLRGQRNEPANVHLVAERIAQVKGLSPRDVARVTTSNATRFFNLPVSLPSSKIAYTIRDSVYLNVTNECMNACIFCQRNINPVVKGHDLRLDRDPTADEMLQALEDEGWRNRSEVVFCGYGEPTIRLEEILNVSSRIRELKPSVKVRLNTNGLGNLYHRRNIVPDLLDSINTVSVSLNAQDAGTFEKMCRPSIGPRPYESLLDFSRKCVAAGLDVILTIVNKPDLVDMGECRKIAEQMGASFRVRPLHEVG